MKKPDDMGRCGGITRLPDGTMMLCIRKGRCVKPDDCVMCKFRAKREGSA